VKFPLPAFERFIKDYNHYYILSIIIYSRVYIVSSRVGSGTNQKNNTSPFLSWMSYKATKELSALTSEIECNQTAICLSSFTSATFLIAK
jgi:hypothetical protein